MAAGAGPSTQVRARVCVCVRLYACTCVHVCVCVPPLLADHMEMSTMTVADSKLDSAGHVDASYSPLSPSPCPLPLPPLPAPALRIVALPVSLCV